MTAESASPGRGWSRNTNAALNGSRVVAASGSGHWPFTRSRSSDRNLVSRKNRPWGKPGAMSPEASEIENAGPSTSVTTPPSPLSDALAVEVHGCDMCDHATALGSEDGPYARSREDRRDRAAVVRRPSDRLRGDRAGGRAAGRRPDRAGARRHPVREW